MQRDENTLPEPLEIQLVRAAFENNESSRQAVEQGLRETSPRLYALALRAGSHHDWIATETWTTSLSDNRVDVRREAVTLLARSADVDVNLDDALVTSLRDEDPLVVDGAAFALGEHLYAPAVEELIVVARDHEDARCRESAIAALGALGDDRARDVILNALSDKPPVRRRAIVALSNFEGPDVEEALDKASDDRDWQVRAAVDQLRASETD
jgi:HEAT repeat protein